MSVADALEKKIMTNVAMIETEDENYDNWTLTKTDNGPKDKKTGQKSQDINKGGFNLAWHGMPVAWYARGMERLWRVYGTPVEWGYRPRCNCA